jgi:hypothetical protein
MIISLVVTHPNPSISIHIHLFATLKENGVQKDGRSNEQGLLVRRSLCGKGNGKGVGIRQHFGTPRLWLLQDFTKMNRIATRIALSRLKDPERSRAAALTTARVALGEAIRARSTAASRRMNEIEFLTIRIKDVKRRNAKVAVLLDGSEFLSPGSNIDGLVTAALARASRGTARAIHREEFRVRRQFLHAHLERVNGVAEEAAKAVGVFERLSDRVRSNKVLEFGLGFATKALLQPAATGLADCRYEREQEARYELKWVPITRITELIR